VLLRPSAWWSINHEKRQASPTPSRTG
jgi:hypothetical protein